MKQLITLRGLMTAVIAIAACAAVHSRALIPFGVLEQKPYEGKFYYATNASGDTPGEEWMNPDFNDFEWGTMTLPAASATFSYYNTAWSIGQTTYWVRYHFTLTAEDLNKFLCFFFAHDDSGVAYINGVKIYDVASAQNYGSGSLSEEAIAALKPGEDNVLAVKVTDTGGGRYMDFGLYASDFQDAVVRSDVPVQFENDADNPWAVEGLNIIRRDNGKSYYGSWLKMSFTSAYKTELSFDWHYDFQQGGQLYIDGVLAENCGTGHSCYAWGSRHFFIEPGEHTIAFRDTVAGRNTRKYFEIRNLRLKELSPIGQSSAMSANSQPLTFKNDSDTPWTIEDGYIEHQSWNVANVSSRISTTFSVAETSKLQFDYRVYRGDNDNYGTYQNLNIYLNGVLQNTYYNVRDFTTWSAALEPGDYTLEIEDTIMNHSDWYYAQIKNIELSNSWITVDLATPGTLGYEALYTPGIDVLGDVEFLKVKGKMNDADWADIKNMLNLKALDLSEAITDAVPDYAFDGLKTLGSVVLPETATSIGQYAFRNTTLRRINIPAAMTEIKQYAFQATPVMYVTFSEGSQLKTINNNAFENCTLLQEIDLPDLLETFGYWVFNGCTALKRVTMGDAVTDIGRYTFYNCKSLESIHFSDAIEIIYSEVCRENNALKEVKLPANLRIIERDAFYNTKSLRSIKFPESLERIEFGAFRYSALDSVALPINLQWLGTDAFSNNSNLKYIEFPSYITPNSYTYYAGYGYGYSSNSGYRSNFQNCPNIEKIVMHSATPPEVNADPFAGSREKTVITLVVPSFAVVNYKLDTYWKQFGSIVEGDDVDYWKITSPLMLTNNRRMQGTPDVDLYYDGQLTVGGAAPLTLKNFNMYLSEENPGRLLNTCDDISIDNMATHFSVAANRWYFLTPLHDVNLSEVTVTEDASYVFRYYDAANRAANGTTGNQSWKNVDTGKLLAGQGYIFQCNKACEITFPASADGVEQLFATTDVTTNLSANESSTAANSSWNYVGNPYPCYYDIYYMDFTAPITVWTGSTYKAYSVADDDLALRPMQPFFVQKPDGVDRIVFKKEGRQLLSTVSSHASAGAKASGLQANAVGGRRVFDLVIAATATVSPSTREAEGDGAAADGDGAAAEGDGAAAEGDQTRVVLNENANLGYEIECDASKFMSIDGGVPQILTLDTDGNQYAINERPAQDGTVTLGYYAAEAGEYVISLKRSDGSVTLTDNETGETTDLSKQAYTFQTDETNGVDTTRFTLTFGSVATSIVGLDSIEAYEEGATYDLQGRRVNAVKKGVYIHNGRKVRK